MRPLTWRAQGLAALMPTTAGKYRGEGRHRLDARLKLLEAREPSTMYCTDRIHSTAFRSRLLKSARETGDGGSAGEYGTCACNSETDESATECLETHSGSPTLPNPSPWIVRRLCPPSNTPAVSLRCSISRTRTRYSVHPIFLQAGYPNQLWNVNNHVNRPDGELRLVRAMMPVSRHVSTDAGRTDDHGLLRFYRLPSPLLGRFTDREG